MEAVASSLKAVGNLRCFGFDCVDVITISMNLRIKISISIPKESSVAILQKCGKASIGMYQLNLLL